MPQPNPLNVIDRFFQWFKGRYHAMFALLALSGAALFMPGWLSDRLRVTGALNDTYLRFALLFFFGFSAIYLILGGFSHCAAFLMTWRHLHHLADDERRTLSAFVKWNVITTGLISGAPTAVALTKKGILDECKIPNPNNIKARRGDSFFAIKPWILRYLRKRPALIHFLGLGPPPVGASWPELKRWLELTNGGRTMPGENQNKP